MTPENHYIRSETMEEELRTTHETDGRREWLKTLLFLLILLLVGYISISIAGPVIFRDYLPAVLGINQADTTIDRPSEPAAKPNVEKEEEVSADDADGGAVAPLETEGEGTEDTVTDDSDGEDSGSGATEETDAPAEEAEQGSQEPLMYDVKQGDTLTSIAAAHETTVEEILAVNQFLNPHFLQVGQKITLP